MDATFIKQCLKDKYEKFDEKYFEEYIKILNSPIIYVCLIEYHHILPKIDFPEYRLSKWNMVPLTISNHINAHKYLWLLSSSKRMASTYSFMCNIRCCSNSRSNMAFKYAMVGDGNPSKRPEVREKIRLSKIGIARNDMLGKSYFGASKEKQKEIRDKVSKAKLNTVIVKCDNGTKFMISKDDPRYISGELVHFAKGIGTPNNSMKSEEGKRSFRVALAARKDRFSKMTANEICYYIVSKYKFGKRIFKPNGKFDGNFSRLFIYASLSPDDYIQKVQSLI